MFPLSRRQVGSAALAVAVILTAVVMVARRDGSELPAETVTRGEFVDRLELRGEIAAVRSVVLAAPSQAGELQIIRLAKSGSRVNAGDLVVEFDGSTLRRTVQEKQSELRQAEAEIDQAIGEARLKEEQNQTTLLKAEYDVERAKLEVAQRDVVARLDFERAKLSLADAEQRLAEARETLAADRASAESDLASGRRKREKVEADLARAERSLAALQLRASSEGTVNILPNFRSGAPFGAQPEFREGDRAWSGAGIAELPDTSDLHIMTRLDEADRGRVSVGQKASVRVDATPDRELQATVREVSVLARVDFSSGWPPPRNFDLKLVIDPPAETGSGSAPGTDHLRPGMSATIRLAVGTLQDVLLVPSEAVFIEQGRSIVYRLTGSRWEPREVEVLRRGPSRTALRSGVDGGDRIALKRPSEPASREMRGAR